MRQDSRSIGPLQVTPRKNESFERMLKRFVKKVKSEGVIRDHVLSKVFEKPSVSRRRKRNSAKWMARNSSKK